MALADMAGAGAGAMPAGWVRTQAWESGGSQRARLHLLLHSLVLSPSHSHTQVVFPSKLAADAPMGAVSSGEGEGRKPEPSYLGKQAEAAKAADDTVYLWQPRPFPTRLGGDEEEEEERDTDTENP